MNLRRETVKMGVQRAAQPRAPRAGQPQDLVSEAYLNSTSQGARSEEARLPARRAYSSERRTAISAVRRRRIHKISGLENNVLVSKKAWRTRGSKMFIEVGTILSKCGIVL
jgi:hypothetical protein